MVNLCYTHCRHPLGCFWFGTTYCIGRQWQAGVSDRESMMLGRAPERPNTAKTVEKKQWSCVWAADFS